MKSIKDYQQEVVESIDTYPEYKETVFNYGFIVTAKSIETADGFPFYNNWNHISIAKYNIYYHKQQTVYTKKADNINLVLIGHAYNPFDNTIDETVLLEKLYKAYKKSKSDFYKYFNEFTGIFSLFVFQDNKIEVLCDYSAFQSVYYTTIDNNAYYCSHTYLAGLLEDLKEDQFVKKLKAYKFYPLYGESLPYNVTEYENLFKVLPNTVVTYDYNNGFSQNRFYPGSPMKMTETEEEYNSIIQEAADILANTMKLINEKFDKPAVSLTGGTDSQTTLAACNNIYDKFSYFSYNSQMSELVDCQAAKEICNHLGFLHKQYDINNDKSIYPEYDLVKAIFFINGHRVKVNHNDIMKRIYFFKNKDFLVEVKSWISEGFRAFFYKKYTTNKFSKICKPKHLTLMSRIFAFNRLLYWQTNAINKRYIEELGINDSTYNYDWSDLFFTEHRYGRWGSGVICGEQRFSFDITIPYNNRLLCNTLLRTPLDKRIKDITSFDLTDANNPEVRKAKVHVVNYHHGRKRELIDKLYFNISRILPF